MQAARQGQFVHPGNMKICACIGKIPMRNAGITPMPAEVVWSVREPALDWAMVLWGRTYLTLYGSDAYISRSLVGEIYVSVK